MDGVFGWSGTPWIGLGLAVAGFLIVLLNRQIGQQEFGIIIRLRERHIAFLVTLSVVAFSVLVLLSRIGMP